MAPPNKKAKLEDTASSTPNKGKGKDLDEEVMEDEEIGDQPEGSSVKKNGGFAGSFNDMKTFNGQYYTGMAIGGSHTWNYDQGLWKETKKEPDLWEIDYNVHKRRAKNAPDNSGAPVGTQYHWLIVAHQMVEKIDANTYTTHLTGSKYKLAHKNANSDSWSITKVKAQRDREIELLQDAIDRIKGLPPVHASEKIKTKQTPSKGQATLDSMFSPTKKRKAEN